jgi:hypothetical protein
VYDEPPERLLPGTPQDYGVSGSMSAAGLSFPRPARRRRSSPPSEESMSWLREYGRRGESPPLRRVRRRLNNDGRRFGIVFDQAGMPITGGDEGGGAGGAARAGGGD